MDRIGVAYFCCRNDRGNVKIAVGRRWRPYADCLISEPDVHCVGIGRRVDRNGLDSHFMRGAVDAKRNLTAVRDQDFLDWHLYSITSKGWSNSTGWPLST